jgi:hypothetical protein
MTQFRHVDANACLFDAGGISCPHRRVGNGIVVSPLASPLHQAHQPSDGRSLAQLPPMPAGRPTLADLGYLAMVQQYRASGGLAAVNQVVGLMREICDQPVSVLARWIVQREVVCFIWKCEHLLPMFQFELRSMSLLPHLQATLSELVPVFDEWELALWFAQPNSWLQGAAPVNLIDLDASAILDAARADRFIATG